MNNDSRLPARVLRCFVATAAKELGGEPFHVMLSISKLPLEWASPQTFIKTEPHEAARIYASLQAALRTYYGRGARGALIRVGENLWMRLLEDAVLASRMQAALIKRLPLPVRRKPTLDLLAKFLSAAPGDITVHTLDLDLLFADHASPSTAGQSASTPVCYVTQGLIRESLRWATGFTFDVQETSCKARGEQACEFTITGGKT